MTPQRLAELAKRVRGAIDSEYAGPFCLPCGELLAYIDLLLARPLPEELQAIKARADAATPGEWRCDGEQLFVEDENGRMIFDAANTDLAVDDDIRNLTLAASARPDILRLLAYVATLAQEVADLRRFLPDMLADYAAASGDGRAAEAFALGELAAARRALDVYAAHLTHPLRGDIIAVVGALQAIVERRP